MAGLKRKKAEPPRTATRKRARADQATTPPANMRVTRQMTTDGPRKAVFATTELLEHMLSFLPPRTLFGCLRTSRKFRDVITNSIDLQRKMDLRDAGTERQLWAVKWPKGTPLDTVSFERVHNRILGPEIQKLVTPVELSFVLKHICYGKSAAYRAMLGFEQAKMLPVRRFAGTPSWRNILLTQPPTAEAEIHLTWSIQNKTVAGGSVRRIVQSDSGVTFGHLFDAVLDVQDKSGTLNISGWREGNLVSTGESTTLRRVLQNLESKYGKAKIVYTIIQFRGVAVPSAAEWQCMDRAGK